MPTISSYFNPCSKDFQTCSDFKRLNVGSRIGVVILTALAAICSLGILAVPISRLLTKKLLPLNSSNLPKASYKTYQIGVQFTISQKTPPANPVTTPLKASQNTPISLKATTPISAPAPIALPHTAAALKTNSTPPATPKQIILPQPVTTTIAASSQQVTTTPAPQPVLTPAVRTSPPTSPRQTQANSLEPAKAASSEPDPIASASQAVPAQTTSPKTSPPASPRKATSTPPAPTATTSPEENQVTPATKPPSPKIALSTSPKQITLSQPTSTPTAVINQPSLAPIVASAATPNSTLVKRLAPSTAFNFQSNTAAPTTLSSSAAPSPAATPNSTRKRPTAGVRKASLAPPETLTLDARVVKFMRHEARNKKCIKELFLESLESGISSDNFETPADIPAAFIKLIEDKLMLKKETQLLGRATSRFSFIHAFCQALNFHLHQQADSTYTIDALLKLLPKDLSPAPERASPSLEGQILCKIPEINVDLTVYCAFNELATSEIIGQLNDPTNPLNAHKVEIFNRSQAIIPSSKDCAFVDIPKAKIEIFMCVMPNKGVHYFPIFDCKNLDNLGKFSKNEKFTKIFENSNNT